MRDYPVVKLSNGIVVANFSSPHQFLFEDGSVLEACSPERAKRLMLESQEYIEAAKKWVDVRLRFLMSEAVDGELLVMDKDEEVDIILVPLPVLTAIKGCMMHDDDFREPYYSDSPNHYTKCRVVRVADRVTKAAYADRFCV
jgi:hypothetical protein